VIRGSSISKNGEVFRIAKMLLLREEPTMNPSSEVLALAQIAHAAGRAIMEIYNSDFTAKIKSDQSPVTAADEVAEAIILAALGKAIPIIAEEQVAAGKQTQIGNAFYLVDPLDGTKEFISRNGEFTVNIGLIENGRPTMGVVYAPAINELYIGQESAGAFLTKLSVTDQFTKAQFEKIAARPLPVAGATILASRSHMDVETEAYISQIKVEKLTNAGSSLKFCRVASGLADLYPRFGRTMEWDTAAGHAVLSAAGGSVTQPDGSPFTYGKKERGFDNGAFIARGIA
jgi:3'(2'), 5'-bisphosphate nucleotidase